MIVWSPHDWNAFLVPSGFIGAQMPALSWPRFCTRLHGAPQGSRFAGPDLGDWYAPSALTAAALEVSNGIRRENKLSALEQKTEELREYTSHPKGDYVDIRGAHPELHDPDSAIYPVAQTFGRSVRTGPHVGIAYDSVRYTGGVNWVAYRPSLIMEVTQARHFRLVVPQTGKVYFTYL